MSEENQDLRELSISIIRSKKAGIDTVVLAAQLIIADALFNARIADLKNSPAFGEDRWLEVLDAHEELYERCKAAAKQFEAGGNREDLKETLIAVSKQLDGLPAA